MFSHLEQHRNSVKSLAANSGMSERTLQALLDGLVAVGAITTQDGVTYANTSAAAEHLVPGKPGYLGTFARIVTGDSDGGMRQWSRLPEAIRNGSPVSPETILAPDHPFWKELVRALLPVSREAAGIAADRLSLASAGEFDALDVGGGAAAYASVWLTRALRARLTQIDWAPVNAVARAELEGFGVVDRFITVDGDLHTQDWGHVRYDYVIISNIAHHEPPARNLALCQKARRALKPGGALVVSDFILRDDRTGPAFALRFGAGMVLQTAEGASYREADYRDWLTRAGFAKVEVDTSHALSTLLFAR